jgi:hypothetical protein
MTSRVGITTLVEGKECVVVVVVSSLSLSLPRERRAVLDRFGQARGSEKGPRHEEQFMNR